MAYKGSEKERECQKKYRQEHRESRNEYSKKYYQTHREQSLACHKAYYQEHKERMKAYGRRYHQEHSKQTKIEVLTYYGDGKLACIWCGFDNVLALSIDHIDGSGKQHRREMGLVGNRFYRWLKQQSYPKGYQTLCMNCQFIKRAIPGAV